MHGERGDDPHEVVDPRDRRDEHADEAGDRDAAQLVAGEARDRGAPQPEHEHDRDRDEPERRATARSRAARMPSSDWFVKNVGLVGSKILSVQKLHESDGATTKPTSDSPTNVATATPAARQRPVSERYGMKMPGTSLTAVAKPMSSAARPARALGHAVEDAARHQRDADLAEPQVVLDRREREHRADASSDAIGAARPKRSSSGAKHMRTTTATSNARVIAVHNRFAGVSRSQRERRGEHGARSAGR